MKNETIEADYNSMIYKIRINRVFVRLRSFIDIQKEIMRKLELLGKKYIELDEKANLIFEYQKQLEQSK